MRAPGFWYDAPGPLAYALSPLGLLYGTATARRMRRAGTKLDVPVICVGNFTAGGTGKTPTVAAIADWLTGLQRRPAIVSRGYGGKSLGPIVVDPTVHSAAEVGDEPLMLARHFRVVVARDRAAGGALAIAAGADIVLLDDGLQNPALHKDIAIAVVDGAQGVGNGFCIPAGPLRASLSTQWPWLTDLVVMGPGRRGAELAELARQRGKRAHVAWLEPDPTVAARLRGERIFGFAGIGRPAKFQKTLTDCGATLAGFQSFGDHHAYSGSDLAALASETRRLGARPVTTEKDFVRIGIRAAEAAFGGDLTALPIRAAFADAGGLRATIGRLAGPGRAPASPD
jgi:tetraacyldisaccharide 4'-kinase